MRGDLELSGVAARARELKLGLDLIVTSPAARTLATAAAYLQAFGLPDECLRTQATIYTAEYGDLADVVQGLPDSADRILLVGHNPAISNLARWLDGGHDFEPFAPATIAVYSIDTDRWAQVAPNLSRPIARLAPRRY
jgi:phosphohistidine phosphatase